MVNHQDLFNRYTASLRKWPVSLREVATQTGCSRGMLNKFVNGQKIHDKSLLIIQKWLDDREVQ